MSRQVNFKPACVSTKICQLLCGSQQNIIFQEQKLNYFYLNVWSPNNYVSFPISSFVYYVWIEKAIISRAAQNTTISLQHSSMISVLRFTYFSLRNMYSHLVFQKNWFLFFISVLRNYFYWCVSSGQSFGTSHCLRAWPKPKCIQSICNMVYFKKTLF